MMAISASALTKLVAELLLVVQAMSGYQLPDANPEVTFLAADELQARVCGKPCPIYGWFPPGNTIYLDDTLDPVNDLRSRSILLHELVHFTQQENGTYRADRPCKMWLKNEWEAYDIQLRWLTSIRAPRDTLPWMTSGARPRIRC